MKRREFFKSTAVAAGALTLLPFTDALITDIKKKYANDVVTLGKTGIKVSRLAMGTGTHHAEKLSFKELVDLLYKAYEHGINFWDSADQYGTHPHLKEALKLVSRQNVVILTKTHAATDDEMKADLERFRKEIGTDYLDIVLLHGLTDPDWHIKRKGAMDVLEKARQDGIIRSHGVSCHTLGALEAASNSKWVQIDLARINPEGAVMDADVPTVVKILQKMHKDGKGIIGMKIFGAGRLRNKVDECLKYVLNLDCVDAFTIGQLSQKETQDLLKRIPAASV
jgi:predicted aldo/keto reductase-like oxidoreductase